MIIKDIRQEIIEKLPELQERFYPGTIPKSGKPPCLVYDKTDFTRLKTLDGYLPGGSCGFTFYINAAEYGEMAEITAKVEDILANMPGTTIGKNPGAYIRDLTFNSTDESYDETMKIYQGVIDFTIYY